MDDGLPLPFFFLLDVDAHIATTQKQHHSSILSFFCTANCTAVSHTFSRICAQNMSNIRRTLHEPTSNLSVYNKERWTNDTNLLLVLLLPPSQVANMQNGFLYQRRDYKLEYKAQHIGRLHIEARTSNCKTIPLGCG